MVTPKACLLVANAIGATIQGCVGNLLLVYCGGSGTETSVSV